MATRKSNYISVFGINHETTDFTTHEYFYLSENEYSKFLNELASKEIKDVYVFNTSMRTEVYCMSESLNTVIDIYRSTKNIEASVFNKHTYIKHYRNAIQHFFEVTSGLKSNYFIDHKISDKIKLAYNFHEYKGLIGSNFEFLFSKLFASLNEIENLNLGKNTLSLTYLIAKTIKSLQVKNNSKILLIGSGDVARITLNHIENFCEQQVKIVDSKKANLLLFEGKSTVNTGWLENLPYLIKQHDVIISTINIDNYITKAQLNSLGSKEVFDLTNVFTGSNLFDPRIHNVYTIHQFEKKFETLFDFTQLKNNRVYDIIDKYVNQYQQQVNEVDNNSKEIAFDDDFETYINWYAKLNKSFVAKESVNNASLNCYKADFEISKAI